MRQPLLSMRVFEFRLLMPLTVEELEVAQRYTVTTATLAETGDGSGTEYLRNQPFRYLPEQRIYT